MIYLQKIKSNNNYKKDYIDIFKGFELKVPASIKRKMYLLTISIVQIG